MKLLVDVGVGKAVEDWLRRERHDILAVRDLDPHMPDETILARAAAEGRLVITMDKDFGALVHASRKSRLGREAPPRLLPSARMVSEEDRHARR